MLVPGCHSDKQVALGVFFFGGGGGEGRRRGVQSSGWVFDSQHSTSLPFLNG